MPPSDALSRQSGNMLVLAYLLGMVSLWTVLCAISHKAPDLDGMEELVWAASLELGYTKHPPLPSWFMYIATQLIGRPIWLPFLMGQLFSALGLWFVWKLGCEFASRRQALIATLLVSTTAYFSLRGTIYNHNTAQLWSIACATWLFYCALRDQRPILWIALGLVGALAMMTKYSALIQFAAFFLYMVRADSLRDARTWRGLGLALAAFLIGVAPHLYWLAEHRFEPLLYADSSLEAGSYLDALADMLDFALDQIGRLAPMLVVLLAWTLWQRRAGGAQTSAPLRNIHGIAPRDRTFLLWVGLAPVLSTLLISALLGTRLEASWASTFFILVGFYGLWWLHGPEPTQYRRIAVLVVITHVLMAGGYALARGPLAWETGRAARSTFPGPEIAALIHEKWSQYQPGHPLRVIVSDTWLGGNIAVNLNRSVQVHINADDEESPWFAPGTALRCGAVVAYSTRTRGAPAAAVERLYEAAPWRGLIELPWSSAESPIIDLHWAVIPSGPDCPR